MKAAPLVPALLASVFLASALLALAGCGGPPPPPPPTLVDVAVSTDARSNAGAPLSLRIYQLASPAAFEGAQFFPLFNGDAVVLKDDLVKRDDLILAPGQSKTLSLAPSDRTKVIGIFAAYRDYETQIWRTVTPIPPNQKSVLTVTSGAPGLTATISSAK